ncbi:MAG: carboxypeptidase regulatory-like domain-containing protein [Acidobacteria bacterium]|nr:carboxypeptidase regulatory-like domain-containing protein [Acidobacteriota bacterium]
MKLTLGYALLIKLVLVFSLVPAYGQTGAVKGKVKERDGKALEGVLIRATSVKNKTIVREARSDSKGDFEFTDLPAGDYSFSLEKKGYATFISRNLTVTADDTLKLKSAIELKREESPYASVRGAVLYGVGFSLPNATVIIERIDGGGKFKQEKLSGEGGEFAFRLKAEKAKYRVTALGKGFQPASTEIEIEGDEVRNIALTLQRSQ